MRQHVNPLSRFFQIESELPQPSELFENHSLPIHLDLGCARGRFLLNMASAHRNWNYIGFDIRETLVVSAEEERNQLNLDNLKFLFCNVNVSLDPWLSRIKSNSVKIVSIQFPDPWFKMRHKKRRVLNSSLLFSLAKNLDEGSKLFLQTDILDVMEGMNNFIDASNFFERKDNDKKLFSMDNPFPFSTEREKYVIKKAKPVYRQIYFRNSIKV